MCVSKVSHWTEGDGFIGFVETFEPGYSAPLHDHRLPYCSLVLRGGYCESSKSHEATMSEGKMSLHPDSEHHAKSMTPDERTAEFYLLVSDPELGQQIRERSILRNPELERLMLSALFAISGREPEQRLIIESALSEIVGKAQPEEKAPAPGWLSRAVTYLYENVGASVGLSELSIAVNVDRSYLARNFRTRFRQTVGEYHRNLRINRAVRSIIASEEELGTIAFANGFSDQSHLGRNLRESFGRTPNALRRICPL